MKCFRIIYHSIKCSVANSRFAPLFITIFKFLSDSMFLSTNYFLLIMSHVFVMNILCVAFYRKIICERWDIFVYYISISLWIILFSMFELISVQIYMIANLTGDITNVSASCLRTCVRTRASDSKSCTYKIKGNLYVAALVRFTVGEYRIDDSCCRCIESVTRRMS